MQIDLRKILTNKCNPFKFCSTESTGDDVPSETKLNDIMHLAELCIDLLHQNEEHHAEVRRRLVWETLLRLTLPHQGN